MVEYLYQSNSFMVRAELPLLLKILKLKRQNVVVLSVLMLVFIMSLAVLQDWMYSLRNSSAFYVTESLLFRIFWVLFLPISYGALWMMSKYGARWQAESVFMKVVCFVMLAVAAHALLFSVLVYGLSAVLFDHTYSIIGNLSYTLTTDVVIYFLLYGLIGVLYFRLRDSQEPLPLQENIAEQHGSTTAVERIVISTAKSYVAVSVDDICCITAAAPYIAIHTHDKEYLHSDTLKALHAILPHEYFVRIHKSTVVNIRKVVSYTSRLNGDYDILLANNREVRLSRNYAKEFKTRLEKISSA